MSKAAIAGSIWTCLPCRGLIVLLCSLLALRAGCAQGGKISFDIPAQPLASALISFADRSGMTALVDEQLVSGLQSSPVNGRLSPSDALRIILAGTGFSIHYSGDNAFTLGRASQETSQMAQPANAHRVEYDIYFSQLQGALEWTLCRNDEIRPGPYRAAFQIWIGDRGAVEALHLLGSTGDEARDLAITAVLTNASVAVPPRELPQPFTVILQQKAASRSCTGKSPLHP
ncbi:STN domain-containing protein [Bradyrhizobium sp. ARR65]|uniref:STN domain-containing protein n=1 Tax=Bradyrhizobium sp. ARR65 TaxID=1040989 RepID=UPI00046442FB|nr:STN domain-containing protein [Bradyrhizobium sp. ARR65]